MTLERQYYLKIALFALAAWLIVCRPALAAGLIRDDEIESYLAELSAPLIDAAGLNAADVRILVVNDRRLNAFAAGGQNVFLNSGLLVASKSSNQLSGVLAHELGHIAGGHLTRFRQEIENRSTQALIGTILGIAAAVATGSGELGLAVAAGGATVAERNILSYSRGQERAADQAAISYLHQSGQSASGLLGFFRVLEQKNLRFQSESSEFLRTHPLTSERISTVGAVVEKEGDRFSRQDPDQRQKHERMVAKLHGFLYPFEETMRAYQGSDDIDLYAQSIALFQRGDIDQSLLLLDQLRQIWGEDAYLSELEGQILFESGRIDQAAKPYQAALKKLPDSTMVKLGFARVLIERNNGPSDLEEASRLLRDALQEEPNNPTMWHFRALAEGRLGHDGEALLALVERSLLLNNSDDARLYLHRARKYVTADHQSYQHLKDLTNAISQAR